jgi:type IV pilus assembly protein PilC
VYLFRYKGRDESGTAVHGKIMSISPNVAAKKLMSEGVVPLAIKRVSLLEQLSYRLRPFFLRFAIVEKQDILRFCSEASLMLRSGVSIRDTVANIAHSLKGRVLQKILEVVVQRMDAGMSISDAFAGFPRVFPPLFLGFLRQADYAEYTSMIFAQLGETLDARKKMRKEMLQALVPFTSSVAMIVLAGYILSQMVMPELLRVYTDRDRPIPYATQLLYDFFQFIENDFLYMLGGTILFVVAVRCLVMFFPAAHYRWDKYMLQLPIYRRVRVLLAKMDFSRAIAMALHNGFPIQKVLHISSAVVMDKFYQAQIRAAVQKIISGEDLIMSIREMKLFTYSEIEILEVGRETEGLEEAFRNVVSFNENDLYHRIHLLREGLNLTVLVFMVFMVSFYMVGFYLGYLYVSF